MDREDLIRYRAFRAVVDNGSYDVNGKAYLAVASLFKWFYELEPKIEKAIADKASADSKIKAVKQSHGKV